MASKTIAIHPRQGWLDAYLGLLQFLFLLTWIVYVIFLPDLLARAGLPKDFAPRLLLADQLLFACADVLLGLYADRAMNLLRRLTPIVLVLNLVSCLIFAGLPNFAAISPALLIAATVTWVISSTVLRAPLYGAIARRSAHPRYGTAWALAGMGLASAAAPYLGIVMKGLDPALPMLISGIALALATLGFDAWERSQSGMPGTAPARVPEWRAMFLPTLTLFLLGAGFQAHFFLNAVPLFKQAGGADALPMLMPLFWVGFSLAVYPGARLLARYGAARLLTLSAFVGALASMACLAQPGLAALIGLQLVAGGAWGFSFLSALDLAGDTGHRGREATFVGLVFAALAIAAAMRIGIAATGLKLPETTSLGLAAGLWTCGALCAGIMLARRPHPIQ
jgi:hypothetical protein